MSVVDLEWERWSREHADVAFSALTREAWSAAFAAGERAGVLQSMQLGVGTTIQQLAEILERMERVARQLAEDEMASPYWRTGA